jgi:3-dehydrosphinganine reductase
MAKNALITGGSSGLGFSLAEILGNDGYQILILARNKAQIDNSVEKLKTKNILAKGFVCDIISEEQQKETFNLIKTEYGKIDFLILNAGVVSPKLLSDYESSKELKTDIEIDLWGTIQTAYFYMPLLVEKSKVLMISSGFGLMGAAGYSTYCAAKAGIVNFGEALRRELLYRKIAVYVAVPGDMDTPQFHYEIAHQPEWMKKGSPRKLMKADISAMKILKQCKGQSKFLIITSPDVILLMIVGKILPRKWKDKIIDKMIHRPLF